MKAESFYFWFFGQQFFFKRLQDKILKNVFFQKKCNSKNRKFWFFDFRQNVHREVVLATSKCQKWIFWTIWHIFGPGKFFHTTFSFFCRSAWKFGFFSIFDFWTSQKFKNHENHQISNALKKANFNFFLALESAYES